MLNEIKQFFRRIYSMIFPIKSVNEAFKIEVPVNTEMNAAIARWHNLYVGKPDYIKDGDYKTMLLPSAVASELARLVTIEMKSEIAIDKEGSSNDERTVFLNKCYQEVVEQLRIQTEYALAKGGIVFKPYLDDGFIVVDFVQADKFAPLGFNSRGEITSCVFLEQLIIDKYKYTRLELHELSGTTYIVQNKAYKKAVDDISDSFGQIISLQSVAPWSMLSDAVSIENVEKPLFSYFKVPLANTIDPSSNLGVSVFSRAEKLIHQADEMWNRINWEFESKETALDISESMVPLTGVLPKREERLYRRHEIDKQGDDSFYNIFSPEIRDSSYFNGLNKIIQRIEFNCGLAYGTLSDVQEVEKTAEEIKSSKQRSYGTVSDIQKSLQKALSNLIYAMDVYCSLYKLAPPGQFGTSFEWDDSIIVDAKTEGAIMLQEISAGLIKPELYLMRRYGVTEEQALEMMPNTEKMQTDKTQDNLDA